MQITCNTSSAHHVQHVVCHVVRRGSSAIKFDRVEITFILALLHCLNHYPMKEGRTPEFPEKTPDDEHQFIGLLSSLMSLFRPMHSGIQMSLAKTGK